MLSIDAINDVINLWLSKDRFCYWYQLNSGHQPSEIENSFSDADESNIEEKIQNSYNIVHPGMVVAHFVQKNPLQFQAKNSQSLALALSNFEHFKYEKNYLTTESGSMQLPMISSIPGNLQSAKGKGIRPGTKMSAADLRPSALLSQVLENGVSIKNNDNSTIPTQQQFGATFGTPTSDPGNSGAVSLVNGPFQFFTVPKSPKAPALAVLVNGSQGTGLEISGKGPYAPENPADAGYLVISKEVIKNALFDWVKKQEQFYPLTVNEVKATADGLNVRFSFNPGFGSWETTTVENSDATPADLLKPSKDDFSSIDNKIKKKGVINFGLLQNSSHQEDESEGASINGIADNILAIYVLEDRVWVVFMTTIGCNIKGAKNQNGAYIHRIRIVEFFVFFQPSRGLMLEKISDSNPINKIVGEDQWSTVLTSSFLPHQDVTCDSVWALPGSEALVYRSPRFTATGDLVLSVAFDEAQV